MVLILGGLLHADVVEAQVLEEEAVRFLEGFREELLHHLLLIVAIDHVFIVVTVVDVEFG